MLGAVLVSDAEMTFRVATSALGVAGDQFVYGLLRTAGAGAAEYRVKLRLPPDGSVHVQVSTTIAGVERPLLSPVVIAGLRHQPGEFIRVRAQVYGTSPTRIRMRAWAHGAAEPSGWQLTVTNSAPELQAPGGVGLRAYMSSGAAVAPVAFSFDDFSVTSITSP